MKNKLTILAALMAALVLACTAALAEGTLQDYLARIADPADPIVYTISTTEFGPLEPGEFAPDTFVELLQQMELEPADNSLTPDGEYVVLNFPEENVRFDFFLAQQEDNYIRKTTSDGQDGELFKATMPEELSNTSGIMSAWYDSLADAQGLVPPIEAVMPEAGWVLDSLTKYNWMSDRASLEVFLEDTESYKVLISWGSSAWETAEWTYACEYDKASGALFARYVILDTLTYDDNGAEVDRKNEYEKESAAVFIVNDRDELVILNPGDETLEGKIFEKVINEDQNGEANSEWNIPETSEMTEDARAAFDKATEGLLGANYDPVAYLAEKDGTRCFLCRVTVVYPGAKPYYALVYVSEEGVENVWDLWIDTHSRP